MPACSPRPPAALAQEETPSTEPSFSVSSRQTYAPSQQPKIWISFREVDHLDFRVYRVKDPIQFFSKLKDAHSFGSEKAELAREKTWLERFHEWKRDLRANIRDFFRSQLRFETRWQYHSARVQERKLQRIPLDVTSYAQVPLLNRQQLALGWRELVPKTRDSEYQEIPVDVHDKGLYLVEVAYQRVARVHLADGHRPGAGFENRSRPGAAFCGAPRLRHAGGGRHRRRLQ